jgi:hypothetical protein
VFVGPDGLIVPAGGVAASEDGGGMKTIEKVKINTRRILIQLEAENADNLTTEVWNFLRLLACLPCAVFRDV